MMCGVAPGAWTSSIGVLSLLCTAPLEKTQKPMPHFGHQPARSAIVPPPPQCVQTPGNARLALIANHVVGERRRPDTSGRLNRASTRRATRPARHRTVTKPRSRRGSPSARQPASVIAIGETISIRVALCVEIASKSADELQPNMPSAPAIRRRSLPSARASQTSCSSRSGPPSHTPATTIVREARVQRSPARLDRDPVNASPCRGRDRGRRARRRRARPGCASPRDRPTARRARCAVVPPGRAARRRRRELRRRSRRPRRSRPAPPSAPLAGARLLDQRIGIDRRRNWKWL